MKNNELPGQMRFVSVPKKQKKKRVKDSFKAYLIEGAERTEQEGYPIIPTWMIPSSVENIKIIPFSKWKEVGKDLKDYYICFFCQDDDFACVLNNPKKYISVFRRAKGIIGFDYSIYYDMPPITQKTQMNNNLALTFFYGMRYIPVIPNVRYGIESTRDEFLKAIPKHSIIAIGSYGCVNSKDEQRRYRHFLDEMLPLLEPNIVIVYGAMPAEVFGEYQDKYRFIQCEAVTGYKKEVC